MTEILAWSDDKPQSPYCCGMNGTALVKRWFGSVFRKANLASLASLTSSAARRYTPPGDAATTSPSTTGSEPKAGDKSSLASSIQSMEQESTIAAQQGPTAAPGPAGQTDSYVLFGVQGSQRTLRPDQISINSRSTDSSVFQGLKKCYQIHRGRLRLWFSIWRLENCEVVKVKCIV